MGFLNGRITYVRYRVSGDSPLPFGEELLEQVQQHALGRHGGPDPVDGVAVGWAGGDHVLDLSFDLGKNVINDALHLAIRIDTDKVPGAILKAYTKIETDARAALNPTGKASKAERQEAKEAARIRAETEAADGRFRRVAHYPVLWDGRSNVLYAGATSASVLDRLQTLFRETFDRIVEPITAGSLAYSLAEARGHERLVEDFGPVPFLGEGSHASVAWADSDASSRDFWGNEFLIWLWHTLQEHGDTIPLPDGSDATVMVAKTLTLDCPRGETGRDCLTNEGPTRLPEAFRALQAGKLPRKAGLIIVRHGVQYELTLQAETLAVSGANLPKIEGASGSELHEARVEGLRDLVETLDLLYDAYGRRRTGPEWTGELSRIRHWLTAA
ncbi:MAG: hypothetical protein P4L84_09780 [Isosphaeraceae bacterium]|nr:hypothetical protein [Isosphaeraceae bacterium]